MIIRQWLRLLGAEGTRVYTSVAFAHVSVKFAAPRRRLSRWTECDVSQQRHSGRLWRTKCCWDWSSAQLHEEVIQLPSTRWRHWKRQHDRSHWAAIAAKAESASVFGRRSYTASSLCQSRSLQVSDTHTQLFCRSFWLIFWRWLEVDNIGVAERLKVSKANRSFKLWDCCQHYILVRILLMH